ncbi:hypothetical protein Trydic_g13038 [Trypoxylus dichotomus]
MELKHLKELLVPYLNSNRKTFVSYKCRRLLEEGENYGSIMLEVKINLLNDKEEQETLKCVAKLVPTNSVIWNLFNIPRTFKKEAAIYNKIVPLLNKFIEEHEGEELDFFAKYLGSRISLNDCAKEVDADAVLVLENLSERGYINCNKYMGINLETTYLLLENLAKLHATFIAFRLSNPAIFETIRPILIKDIHYNPTTAQFNELVNSLIAAASKNGECLPLLPRMERALRNYKKPDQLTVREAFSSIIHGDLWTNNFMVKFDDGKPVEAVFLDFQLVHFNSIHHDIIFFLYMNPNLQVLQEHLDKLIDYYYDVFIGTLKKLNCGTELFAYSNYIELFAEAAEELQFFHLLLVMGALYTVKSKVKDISKWTAENLVAKETRLHENYYKRLHFIIKDFAKRNWI